MRKLYSLVAFAVMSMMSLTASAQYYTLPSENPVLQSEAFNYRLYKDVNFADLTINGTEMGVEALTFDNSVTTDEIKFNGYAPYRCSVEGLENLWCAVSTPNYTAGRGIQTNGSGDRGLLLSEMKTGQIIVMQGANGGYNNGGTNPNYNGFCVPNGSRRNGNTTPAWSWEYFEPLQVEDISPEVHDAQYAAALAAGEIEEGTDSAEVVDKYLYLRVLNDGWVSVPMERGAWVYGYQIWIDAAADEAVTTPSLKIVGVNGDSRRLEFKAGESTLGMSVSTYYSLNGDDPIFLKDSEEIDHYDYIYEADEEGNQVVVDSTAVYKRVLDTDLVAEVGDYGDMMYNPEDGYIDVYASEDEDGDGIVVVKAASVSETGAVSDVVTVNVAIGEITLNAPTLELQGFSGLDRLYAIKWVNNTICDEEFSITYEGDGGALYGEAVIDDVIAVKNDVTVTVKVEGYADGVGTYEADAPGIDIHRKAAVTEDGEGNAIHDWDFVNLTAEQQAIIKGEVVESCYIIAENGDSLVYTAAEYEEGVAADGTDLSGATANYAASCWWWDGSRSRATLNVASDTIVDPATIHDLNDNGYGYVEDFAHVYDGFTISCPPNASNNSCLFIYINGDLGAYFMAQPTFTFPRESVAAGEYLLVYQGQGGSNYTDRRWPTIYEAATGELLSFSLARNGIHVFYMDVYTYDNLPADEYDPNAQPIEDAIQNVKPAGIQKIVGYYSVNGAKLAAPQKGINIVKYADGASAKILVK
ncbi:MAG: hypothetical protein IJ635_06420 [Bacteroidaceae bacterium]|nr:hypothetical protein [Bacteroidaceae bacterium]